MVYSLVFGHAVSHTFRLNLLVSQGLKSRAERSDLRDGPRRGPSRQGFRGPAEALLRLIKPDKEALFERERGNRFPLFLRFAVSRGCPAAESVYLKTREMCPMQTVSFFTGFPSC